MDGAPVPPGPYGPGTAAGRTPDLLAGVPLLRGRSVAAGQRWVYSAGFNVGPALTDTSRIDSELDDLRRLSDAGARVAVLSHQGRWDDGSARHLDYVARYLQDRLRRPVRYFPENDSAAAQRTALAMRPGEVTLFGNTRFHAGEAADDSALAQRFAALGEVVALAGFSKAHRRHASNVGLTRHLPACVAGSLETEVRRLSSWAARPPAGPSLAVLGGRKPEKTLIGLPGFCRMYDVVVPGGVVLNTVLKVLGYDVGGSDLGSDPRRCAQVTEQVLALPARAVVHVPHTVMIAPVAPRDGRRARRIGVAQGVPDDHMIVDFVPRPWLRSRLRALGARGGRAVLAGTPGCYPQGHRFACRTLLAHLSRPSVDALLVGGDTVAELPWGGASSTGGGSALQILAHGTCTVLDALRGQGRAGGPLLN
ncbi:MULTISPECIES: phosphoglycerate kinase [unclassified Streptomyces]|uniref:phosphoglycerate kinase n=1 Tax=unclassified Streptomyces TaxID=2593676 RepID=UPI00131CE42A|nr:MULTISPECIES: phosphoglycerate kinase [unclassified Streptomyces]